MSTSAILVSTVLAVLFVLALALLTGSLALLAGGHHAQAPRSGLASALRLLDKQWPVERLIYRHHRTFGLLVLAASSFCLWQLTRPELMTLLAGRSPVSILLWILLIGQALALLIGLIIFIRPSLLKPVETVSNRWLDLELAAKDPPARPRITAILLMLVGLIVLLASASLLLQQITSAFG